ncbi:MAG: GntR family transcriptional regulator [Sphingomonas sp.]|uniref:GntR family transcriptional regulator n=1 Tax=Sphingomonas sp. TaxID=28214 RepID=UPI0025CF6622|nr:GntR family transcriptional regulator [Sphingomonas sp.]MBX3563579.1 GntR family transcriptional regulator [Sphingomonas sp.]
MGFDLGILHPIDRGEIRRTAVAVFESLQAAILDGRLRPDTILSQVEVAKALNVSRTPVREAMRMLQEGGLLVGEPNYRSRVVGFDASDIEALYIKRVTLEALAVSITTKRMTDALCGEIGATIQVLEGDEGHRDFECWRSHHRRLHQLMVSQAGSTLIEELRTLELRSARYQSASKGAHLPGWWQRGEDEHRRIFAAISERNVAQAGELAARHLARTALELLAALAPEFDSSRLRDGLHFAIAGCHAVANGN